MSGWGGRGPCRQAREKQVPLSCCPSRKKLSQGPDSSPTRPTAQVPWPLGASSSMQKIGKFGGGVGDPVNGEWNWALQLEGYTPCPSLGVPRSLRDTSLAFTVCMCACVRMCACMLALCACARMRVRAVSVCAYACVRLRAHLGWGYATSLTGGCLRFLPGRPTFRAVVLGSCRSSLPRASSCSSPSCGHRHSL